MLVLGLFEVLSQVKLRADSTGESLEGFDTVDADNTEEDHSSFGMNRGRERAASHDSSASSVTSDHCLGNDVDDEGIEMQPQVVKNNGNDGEDLAMKARGKSPLLDMAKNHLADEDVGSVASSNPSEDLQATPSFDPDVIDFEPPNPPAAPLVDEDTVQSDIMQLRDVADELIAAAETEQLTAVAEKAAIENDESAASIPVRNKREDSVCKSEPEGETYHMDNTTGETSWELPDDALIAEEEESALDLGQAPQTPEVSPCEDVPQRSLQQFSVSVTEGGDEYFINNETQETVWDLPEDGEVVEI